MSHNSEIAFNVIQLLKKNDIGIKRLMAEQMETSDHNWINMLQVITGHTTNNKIYINQINVDSRLKIENWIPSWWQLLKIEKNGQLSIVPAVLVPIATGSSQYNMCLFSPASSFSNIKFVAIEYIAMSYSWEEISSQSTIAKACVIAARTEGVEYIWLDKTAISNDSQILGMQLVMMKAIYANAKCVAVIVPSGTKSLGETLWSTRCWTLQEYLFAKRVIAVDINKVIHVNMLTISHGPQQTLTVMQALMHLTSRGITDANDLPYMLEAVCGKNVDAFMQGMVSGVLMHTRMITTYIQLILNTQVSIEKQLEFKNQVLESVELLGLTSILKEFVYEMPSLSEQQIDKEFLIKLLHNGSANIKGKCWIPMPFPCHHIENNDGQNPIKGKVMTTDLGFLVHDVMICKYGGMCLGNLDNGHSILVYESKMEIDNKKVVHVNKSCSKDHRECIIVSKCLLGENRTLIQDR